jgi:hypothetical protein
MSNTEVFEIFSARFVRPEFRTRFVHEAVKKPDKLYARVCHNIDDLFKESLANGRCTFNGTDPCIMLAGLKGFRAATWSEAHRLMGLGDGLLVIGSGGTKFYAETEAMQGAPSVSYAAGS